MYSHFHTSDVFTLTVICSGKGVSVKALLERFSHRDLDVFEDLLIGSVNERRGTTAPGISNRTADLTLLPPAADIRTADRSSRSSVNNKREQDQSR